MDNNNNCISNKKQCLYNICDNNKVFPDYLEYNILLSIINYLLINNKNYGQCKFSIKRYLLYIEEIIQYSLISKKWFKMISCIISNNMKSNSWVKNYKSQLNYQYSILKITPNSDFNVLTINLNQDDNNDYDDCDDYNQYNETVLEWYKFKKVKFNINGDTFYVNRKLKLFKNGIKECTFDKIEININLKVIEIEDTQDQQHLSTQPPLPTIINKFSMTNSDFDYEYDTNLIPFYQFKPKIFKFSPNATNYLYGHCDYTNIFNIPNEVVEIIKIDNSDHVEVNNIANLNNCTKLHTLTLSLLFHDIVKCLNHGTTIFNGNGCDELICGMTQFATLQIDWCQFINTLSTNKSIKNLTLVNFCPVGLDCLTSSIVENTNDNNNISNDIITIFKENLNFHFLKLVDADFISNKCWEYLLFSSQLNTLVIKFTNNSKSFHSINNLNINQQPSVISQSLVSSIVHFKFYDKSFNSITFSNILNLLIKYQINFKNLYSISFLIQQTQFNQILSFIKIISLLKEKLSTTIKEIIVYLYDCNNSNNRIISKIYNGIILNIYTLIKK